MSAATRTKLFLDRNLLIIFGVTATAMLGTGSITPAFPQMMAYFNIDSQQAGWMITINTLPGIFLAPVWGVVADRIGRKKVLVPSLVFYALCGGAQAFTDDFTLLLALRFFQGCAGAPLAALNNTVIGELYVGRERMEAMGYNASVQSACMLGYPLLGGAVALFGWHYPFLLPLLGLPVAWFVAVKLNNPEPKRSTQPMLDYLGSALKSVANRRMAALYFINILTVAVSFGVLIVYFTLLLSYHFGANSFEIGVITAFSPVVSGLLATQVGRIRAHMSFRQMIVVGLVLSAIGVSLNMSMPSLWWLLVPAFIRGIAQGILNPSVNTLVVEFAPHESRAAVMSLNSTMFRIGQTFGPFLFGLVYAVGGLDAVFHVGGGTLILTAIVAGLAIGDVDKVLARRRAGE
jgi:MFS family permease